MSNRIDSFLRRIHRRWIALRALEHAGLGLLGGCGIAMLLGAIRYWKGESTSSAIAFGMVFGAMIGLVIGLMRRPTMLESAAEADRQLGLADLLGTALSIRRGQVIRVDELDDAWSQSLLTMADARCATFGPNAVVLNRLGARAWGSIGLSAALALTLGLISSNPLVSRAAKTSRVMEDSQSAPDEVFAARHYDRVQQPPNEPPIREATATVSEAVSDETRGDETSAAGARRNSDGGGDGAGGGAARTAARRVSDPSQHFWGIDAPHSASQGISAGGNGLAAGSPQNGDNSPGVVSPGKSTLNAPPWKSNSWPADRAAASNALDRGQIPDAYRDLVRDYFER